MKVPLVWLQDYVDIQGKKPAEVAAAFTQLGLMLDKPLDDSGVLDLEHRMDRADWLSITGCARDLAAYWEFPLKLPHVKIGKLKEQVIIPITVQTPHVRRFKTRVIKGVKVKPSPPWLKERIEAYGIDSVNNVVDITNFCLVELGQPMHAQDLAKLEKPEITIRQAVKGESIITLLGTKVELNPNIFILSSGDTPTVIGGIVGGKASGVTDTTKDIILDAGNYDQNIIRKNSRSLKIINESVSRYDKFLDPRAIDFALDRATVLIIELAGGTPFENGDYYPQTVTPRSQKLRYARLELLSGIQISHASVKKILKNLGYTITEESDVELVVEVPYYRTDVEVEDDLLADILRIRDYNNLPTLAFTAPAPINTTPLITTFEEKLRDAMTSLGADEHITSSLVKSREDKDQILLENALSEDQNALRTSLAPALERILTNYAKHGVTGCIAYEIGKVFSAPNNELRHLTAVTAGDIRSVLTTLMQTLGIKHYTVNKNHEVQVDSARVGELISKHVFTLETDALMKHVVPYSGVVSEFTHETVLDLSLELPKDAVFAEVEATIRKVGKGIKSVTVPDQHKNSLLVRITFAMQLKDVDGVRASLIKSLKETGVVSRSG